MTKLTLPMLLLCTALTQAQTRSTPLAVGDAVPDVTLRTEEGTRIRFADVNPDYQTRLEPAKILEAAKGAAGGAQGSARKP